MTRRHTSIRILASLMATTTFMPQVGLAQTSEPVKGSVDPATDGKSDSSVAEDIVVVAQRRSENLSKVPLSVSAFSGDTLASTGIADATQLTRVVPGLTFAKSGSNTPIYTLRGVGFNTRNISSTSPVGIYVNEVAHAYPYMSGGPIFDLAQVEVLKGPQGTLYGRNTTGGLINFITARPAEKFEAGVSLTVGNYKTYNLEGYVSGSLGAGFTARLAGITENSDEGWQRSITRGDRLGEKRRYAGRLSLDYEAGGPITSQFTASYWRDKSDTQAAQAVALRADVPPLLPPTVGNSILANPGARDADWNAAAPGLPPLKANAEFYSFAERLEFALADKLSLISLTAYSHLTRKRGLEAAV